MGQYTVLFLCDGCFLLSPGSILRIAMCKENNKNKLFFKNCSVICSELINSLQTMKVKDPEGWEYIVLFKTHTDGQEEDESVLGMC